MQILPHAVRATLAASGALALAAAAPAQVPPLETRIPVLIVSGANNHDWEFSSRALRQMLSESGRFDVEITLEPAKDLADDELLARFQVLVLDYNGPRWGEAAERGFLGAVRNGMGVAVIHAANNAFPDWNEYALLVGDTWRDGTGHGSFHKFDVRVRERDHPVTRALPDLVAHPDELYHRLVRTPGATHRVLATAHSSKESGGTGADEPMVTAGAYGKGRVFHTALGHVWKGDEGTRASLLDPQLQRLIGRGVEWAATGDVRERPELGGGLLSPLELACGWRALFDGKTAAGWRGYKQSGFPEGWRVENGALICSGKGGDLISEEAFGDFELAFQWRVGPGGNSGVMYRVSEDQDYPWRTGPEYQVLDDALHADGKNPLTSAGSLYALAAPQGKGPVPAGEFHDGRIVVRGFTVEHWVDGVRVVQLDLASDAGRALIGKSKFASMPGFARNARGHISLQDHGDEVQYRAIKVRDLPPPGQLLLFDGKSLAGWRWEGEGQAADAWSVSPAGELVCDGAPTGFLRTEGEFRDFVLELEWRYEPGAPAGANSGVLLRPIGSSRPWPKSFEAQLALGNAGDIIRIGNFAGSGDPARSQGVRTTRMHATERPAGEWNHMEIALQRGEALIHVNGRLVNLLAGAELASGPVCLQSEGAPIRFRNIRLIPLH